MKATAKPESQQTDSEKFDAALREQEQLKAALSPEALEEDHRRKVEKFNRLCEEASREARANGLTEEILAEILAEE